MVNVINPIPNQSIREGKVADVIHAIAQDMMGRRSQLLQTATKVPKGESRSCRKQSRLLEEYSAMLEEIYYQLEPERWDPGSSTEMLKLAQAHHIALPDWMKPGKPQDHQPMEDNTEDALNRFENEGGRNVQPTASQSPNTP